MSADDLIRDPATIRATDEPDRDDRYWAAILRDRAIGDVDAVTRLADSEQAATNNRLDQAEARVDALLTERDELRASVTEYEASLQAAQSRLARVRELADEWDNMDPGLVYHMVHWDYRTELRAVLDEVQA